MSTPPRVAIIDYQMSNLFSVKHACEYVGLDSIITSDAAEVRAADAIILPGVGAFGDAMKNLRHLGLDSAMLEGIGHGKPFLGVCLGLQLLFSTSEEFGRHQGLDVIPGRVKKFPPTNSAGQTIKVPQIGWNTIHPSTHADSPDWSTLPLNNVKPEAYMYFVHSYYVEPSRPEDIVCLTTYEGVEYCSGVARDNVFAVQFHPEKSGPEGIKIYQNWAATVKSNL